MSTLDDAVAALNQIQSDDSDVQNQVNIAVAAVQAAQQGGGVDPNDAIVTGVVGVLTTAGYTVTAPTAEAELPEGPVEDSTDTPAEA
jgi:hypothetical protein